MNLFDIFRASPSGPRDTHARRAWLAALLVSSLGGLLPASQASAAAEPPASPTPQARPLRPFVQLQLPQHQVQGQRAVQQLGPRLHEIASRYGRTPEQLRELLTTDRAAWLDRRGRLFFVEEPSPLPTSAGLRSDPLGAARPSLAPLDQTFALHSRPGARRTLYLNFRGADLSQSVWGENRAGLYAEPFSVDSDPNSFSTLELERIQYVWQRVAEAYAAFEIDVTTQDPGQDALRRNDANDERYGTTAVITRDTFLNCGCGGIAYVGVFDAGDDHLKPALVFYNALGGGDEKSVADAAVHEVGHNLGLSHDGTATQGYYLGHGEGATGWAPVMGAGYYKPLVQWSRGEYAGANNTEDDYAVMANNGLPLMRDDHGASLNDATPLQPGTQGYSARGVVEHPGDRDVFRIVATAGAFSFTVQPAARGAMLDVMASLHDANGQPIAWHDAPGSLATTVSATLPYSGTYYLVVDGSGQGDPRGTGYSDYGSIGQYTLSAGTPSAQTLRSVALPAATAPATSGPVRTMTRPASASR
ncbi:zinc-dependent metalloprotease family protein [Caldimonas brevitalea]|uniref:Uncharacterized protein n=1 Tax=Caldimonas brevitalea TaxID=413882 RepID=A0A0G3C076_9BURK|nr:zinc-dependent metalloprotease family protein [Caldimonas brevitalea]AKJ32185.1 hypothetical protein AAW51_5494 [Caldimonas brevitalea]